MFEDASHQIVKETLPKKMKQLQSRQEFMKVIKQWKPKSCHVVCSS